MIKIVAKKHIRPENEALFLETAKELIEKSRAEDGCVFYTINRSLREENVLAYVECWRDREAIAAHNASEHFRRLVPVLNALCDESFLPELYEEIEVE